MRVEILGEGGFSVHSQCILSVTAHTSWPYTCQASEWGRGVSIHAYLIQSPVKGLEIVDRGDSAHYPAHRRTLICAKPNLGYRPYPGGTQSPIPSSFVRALTNGQVCHPPHVRRISSATRTVRDDIQHLAPLTTPSVSQ